MDENATGEAISRWFHRVWRRGLMRSGLVTGILLAMAALAFVLAYRQHVQGNFHKLKERMASERPQAAVPLPGGQEAIDLTRTRIMDDTVPEFLSVTLLPGRGMNVLQIRAFVPSAGEIDLLASPPVEKAAAAMTGKGADAGGQYSMHAGGAFEVPWADGIWGLATHGNSPEWEGHAIQLPSSASPLQGGMMLALPSTSSNTSTLPDGGQAEAIFQGFGEYWPSTAEVKVATLLSSHTVDLTVTVRNTGKTAEPVGIGWRPRFAIHSGSRSELRLHIPAESVIEQGKREDGLPTSRLIPVAHTPYDYTARDGATLPAAGIDACFADLTQGVLDNGPAAELSDPVKGYKLRLTALSPEIKAMRVTMPEDGSYLSIDPQFNYPDPFGREWGKSAETGMVVLQPGESTQWKVRMEILPLNEAATQ